MNWLIAVSCMVFSFSSVDNVPNAYQNLITFTDVNLEDLYYNDVLNDIEISFEIYGEFTANCNEVSQDSTYYYASNSLDVSLRFESLGDREVNFSALSDLLYFKSRETFGSSAYSMLFIEEVEFEVVLTDVSYSPIGLNMSYDLYLGFFVDSESFYFTLEFDLLFEDIPNKRFLSEFAQSYNTDLLNEMLLYSTSSFCLNNTENLKNLVVLRNNHYKEQGFVDGYEKGLQEGLNSTPYGALELITKPFVEMGKFLNINIAPNLTLGMIIAIPIIVAIIGFLIKALIA